MLNKTTENQAVRQELLLFILDRVKALKLSGYQLSKLTDLSHVGIDKILDGRSKSPSIRNLEKLKEAINTFENQQHSPVTLLTLNEKLDFIITSVQKLNDKIDVFALDNEIILQILKTLLALKKLEL
ncbi:hypothetical protein [Chryseobacterium sp. MEBOG07]|uniref:hypothetical protein n=1 Tax=Chryseobacterium sp. MEBOG07 TaxID=2879939 RepID=UPI001F481D01|nr:hypothetical protein [Chryseobacterium sp. MEBOG07]UKB81239.1 hypothetical protein LF886_09685 [Chryseobacterium sp. MEBOG07]